MTSQPLRPAGDRAAAASPRRAEILAAAAELFARRGYHGASIGDLGRAVGLTGPALYRHFRGKEAVLAEMLLDISERLRAEGARRAADPDPGRALDALLRWHIAFALDNPALITVHERELDNVPEPQRHEIRRLQRAYVEEWVGVLRRLRPEDPPTEDRARAAVHACFGLLNSTPYSAAALDRAAMGDLLYAMASAALRQVAEPSRNSSR
ncbi:TetR family transcriptional regulator [Actinomadura rubrobrunea]|uniref:TetR family transcriptional regulator n=1 Tax=Actinomadura rubrobrunea TaxID=115335 RepID=A0A9W6PZV8_9ACTN|nr:TetR/AcrR family transcriptional regulator [Actinomadura rubrobrunea]GLW66191.1 TetR family transcriptional regulator [Actinomadura rubrobrunea]